MVLKSIGSFLGGFALLVVGLLVVALLLNGVVWIADKLFPITEFLGALGLVVIVPLLLLAIFPQLRGFCGNGIILVPCVFSWRIQGHLSRLTCYNRGLFREVRRQAHYPKSHPSERGLLETRCPSAPFDLH